MDFLIDLDHRLFGLVNTTLIHPWLDWFFPAITDLHKTWAFRVLVPALLMITLGRIWGLKRGFGLFATILVCVGLSDAVANYGFKKTVQRDRPPQTAGLEVIQRSPAGSYSFPSNHATNTFALATVTSAFIAGTAPWLFGIAVLVSYSRIYNGVHFPLDVLFGAFLGITIASFFIAFGRKVILRKIGGQQ